MKAISFLSSAADAGSPPSEFRIFQFGVNRAQKMAGDEMEFILDQASAAKVMDAFRDRGLDGLPIDLDHQIIDGGTTDTAGKSYGWFVPEIREDGLYATNIKWTPEGADLLKGKAYRFFSPVFFTDDDDRIVDLINVALTNLPALKDIAALVAANQKPAQKVIKMKQVLTALGVSDDADEATTLSAVEKLKADAVALKAEAESAKAEMLALTAKVTQLQAEATAKEVNAMIDEAVKDGRVSPAKRDTYQKLAAKAGVDMLRETLATLSKQPGQVTAAVEPQTEVKASATAGLTADQIKIISTMGLKPEQFAEFSARRNGTK